MGFSAGAPGRREPSSGRGCELHPCEAMGRCSGTTHTSCPARPWQSWGPSPKPPLPFEFTLCPGVSRALPQMPTPLPQPGSRLTGRRGARGPTAETHPLAQSAARSCSATLVPRGPPPFPSPPQPCIPSIAEARCRHHGLFAEQTRLAPASRGASLTGWKPPRSPACGADAAAAAQPGGSSPPTPTGTNKTGASPEAGRALGNTRPPLSCLLLAVSCSLAGDGVKASNCSKCDQ